MCNTCRVLRQKCHTKTELSWRRGIIAKISTLLSWLLQARFPEENADLRDKRIYYIFQRFPVAYHARAQKGFFRSAHEFPLRN